MINKIPKILGAKFQTKNPKGHNTRLIESLPCVPALPLGPNVCVIQTDLIHKTDLFYDRQSYNQRLFQIKIQNNNVGYIFQSLFDYITVFVPLPRPSSIRLSEYWTDGNPTQVGTPNMICKKVRTLRIVLHILQGGGMDLDGL